MNRASIPRRQPRPPEIAIPCPVPTCRAQAGHRCTTPSGKQLRDGHPSRLDAWLVQQHAA